MTTTEIRERSLAVNGIKMHVAEAGTGPLVLLCHGWPELSHSWRHQLHALAQAGFRAVAPDMRGFGRTEAPADVSAYSVFHLTGDMVALVSALGEQRAHIVGHDWGAPVAWHAALFRPDVFRSVACLSVPFRARAKKEPLATLRESGLGRYYWIYFQEPGVAEAEFERDVDTSLRKIFHGFITPEAAKEPPLVVGEGAGFLDRLELPQGLPAWMNERDLEHYVAAYRQSGFRGGMNWYRNISRNWELTAPWQDAYITLPALFMAGTRDPVVAGAMGERAIADMQARVPAVKVVRVQGAGHWLQQERADEVNQALVEFLRAL